MFPRFQITGPTNSKTPFRSHCILRPKTFNQSLEVGLPDLSNSLAHHARTLSFRGLETPTLADPGISHWIRTFYCVETLYLSFPMRDNHEVSFTRLHGFFSTLKSLDLVRFCIPLSKIFNLICSFPLLEDLGLFAISPNSDTEEWNPPPRPDLPEPLAQVERFTPSYADCVTSRVVSTSPRS